eukprot:6210832-Pleurochrysis_carterae.AAC.3
MAEELSGFFATPSRLLQRVASSIKQVRAPRARLSRVRGGACARGMAQRRARGAWRSGVRVGQQRRHARGRAGVQAD